MHEQDMQLAGRVGKFAGYFPEVWQAHQDWLRDIVSSQAVLTKRYSAWQAGFIFRWRLLYFTVYVVNVALHKHLTQHLENLSGSFREKRDLVLRCWPGFAQIQGRVARFMSGLPTAEQYRYILQRTATLLAVAELTLWGVAAITGILIAFYYQPAAMAAHTSLTTIVQNITSGDLILSLHHVAGQGLIILALVQIIVMFLGREFLLPWLVGWMSGVLLTLAAIGLSWTAIVLNWEQTSFWRFKIELSIVGSLPWVGAKLQEILSGGGGINSITLQHMYALHSYILAIAALLLTIIHLTALLYQEQQWPKGLTSSKAPNPPLTGRPQS